MKFQLLESEISYPNELKFLQEIFEKIIIKTEEDAFYFSHFEVDGVDIYEDYEEYLTEHINSIQTLVAHLLTKKDLIKESILSLENYISNAVPEIQMLSEEYYQIAHSTTWEKFQDLISGIEWINDTIILIDMNEDKPLNWSDYLKKGSDLQVILKQLLEGLHVRDEILIADILQYEIIPIFRGLAELTVEITNTKCKKDLLN